MANVGDKYIIEIAEITKGAESGWTKYRIKGFDNLVFDKKGLARLEKVENKESSPVKDHIEPWDEVMSHSGKKCIVTNVYKNMDGIELLDLICEEDFRVIERAHSGCYKKTGNKCEAIAQLLVEARKWRDGENIGILLNNGIFGYDTREEPF